MNLPAHITRQQITDAFAALGIRAEAVTAMHYESHEPWVDIDIRPADSPPAMVAIALRFPIVEQAPQDAADLVALARQEARG